MIEFDKVLKAFGEKAYTKQVFFTALVYWNAIPYGMHTLAPIFYAAPSNYWCDASSNNTAETLNALQSNSVNASNNNILEWNPNYDHSNTSKCSKWVTVKTCGDGFNNVSCANALVEIKSCDGFYQFNRTEFTNTIIMEWDLICGKEILTSIATSLYMAGMWFGSVIFGYISDRFGRRPSMLIAVFGGMVSSLSLNLSRGFWTFQFLRFFVGVFCYPTFMISFIYVMEINYKQRTLAGLLIHIPFALGHAFNSLIAYYCRDWRIFNIVISLFFVPYLFFHILIPESPRWYFSNCRDTLGKGCAQKFLNKNDLDQSEIETIWSNAVSLDDVKRRNYSSVDLFKAPGMRKLTIKVILIWFSVSLLFYGLSLNVGALSGNIFINNAMNAGVGIGTSIIVIFTLDRVGRRRLLVSTIFTAGLCCIINAIVNTTTHANLWRVIVSLLGKMGVAGAFQVLYNFTAELYPTVVRSHCLLHTYSYYTLILITYLWSNGVGVGSMAARIGSICTPFIVSVYDVIIFLPDVIFGVVAFVAGTIVLTLPETTKRSLPQTMKDAESMYRKSSNQEAHLDKL